MENKKPSEASIQQSCVVWFRNNYQRKGVDKGLVLSIPNERMGGYKAMAPLLKTGLLGGASDLIVLLKGRILFVEMKDHKGTQSPKQIKFQSQVENLGYKYYLVRTLKEFKEIVDCI